MICFTRAKIEEAALSRPPGYLEEVLSRSQISGDQVCMTPETHMELRRKYQDSMGEPSVRELATNFLGAVGKWISAGFPVVDEATYAERSLICESCQFWNGSARFGLGECKAPGCGCTRFKRFLATEKCPMSKWPR